MGHVKEDYGLTMIINIPKKGDLTYTDILRKLKSDPELMDLGESVR